MLPSPQMFMSSITGMPGALPMLPAVPPPDAFTARTFPPAIPYPSYSQQTYPTYPPAYPQPMPNSRPPMGSPAIAPIRAKDPEIKAALRILEQTENMPQDEEYLKGLGINILFHNGREAIDVIRARNASVEFGDIGDTTAHAAWFQEENKMIINQRYKGDMSLPVQYAIAESIYHEAGHAARLGDNQSSIQEELDCLALNTLAYRAHAARDPRYVKATSSGPLKQLFENGVALYPKLFFDPDPYKQKLVNRVIEKYGMLPPDTPDHLIPHLPNNKTLTERVIHEIHRRNTRVILDANLKFGQRQPVANVSKSVSVS